MDFSSSVSNYHVAYSSCGGGAGIAASQVRLVFGVTDDRVCKIGVFGADPCAASFSLTEDPYTDPVLTFDLLLDTSRSVSLPSVTVTPTGCYTVSWAAHETFDDSDLVDLYGAHFVTGATDLSIVHTPGNFADRLILFALNGGTGNFYF